MRREYPFPACLASTVAAPGILDRIAAWHRAVVLQSVSGPKVEGSQDFAGFGRRPDQSGILCVGR